MSPNSRRLERQAESSVDAAHPALRQAARHRAGAGRVHNVRGRSLEHLGPALLPLIPWTIAALAVLVAGIALWKLAGSAPPIHEPVRFPIGLPAGVRIAAAHQALAIDRAGSALAFAGCTGDGCAIYVRRFDRLDITRVAGTIGGASPFFSPDGRRIGFFAEDKLQTVDIDGGNPMVVAEAPDPGGGCWLADGRIVYAPSPGIGLMVVPAGGGPPATLTMLDRSAREMRHVDPDVLPDGRGVVFTVLSDDVLQQHAALLSLETGHWHRVIDGAGTRVVPGFIVTSRGRNLLAARFDSSQLALTGFAVPVLPGALAGTDHPQFTTSPNGTVAWLDLRGGADQRPRVVVVLDWTTELGRLVPESEPPAMR